MSESIKQKILVSAISAAVGAIITGGVSIYLNAKTEDQMRADTENAIVKVLSDEFVDITRDMEFDEAIGQMKKDIDTLRKDKDNFEAENTDLKIKIDQLNKLPKVEYNPIGIVVDGLREAEEINNGWADIDGKNYYSEDVVNSLLESKVYLDDESKTLFYDVAGISNPRETKVVLGDTDVLYDGVRCDVYDGTDANTFSLGSTSYNSGFVLGSAGGGGGGYALFDLKRNFSKISMDVGRLAGSEKADATLSIFLNDKFVEEIQLSSNVTSKYIEIDLAHSDNMKIELRTSTLGGRYGFANVVFEY